MEGKVYWKSEARGETVVSVMLTIKLSYEVQHFFQIYEVNICRMLIFKVNWLEAEQEDDDDMEATRITVMVMR